MAEAVEQFLGAAGFERGPWLAVAFAAGIACWFVLANAWQWLALLAACLGVCAASLAALRPEGRFPFFRQSLAALALSAAILGAPRGASADQRGFWLVNQSGSTITRLYVSPTSSDNWGPDQLGADVVHPGGSFSLYFAAGQAGNTCMFDLRIVTASGSA